MSLLEKRPGEIFAIMFVIGGILLTVAVSGAEFVSGIAGRGFDDGIINGAGNWDAENR